MDRNNINRKNISLLDIMSYIDNPFSQYYLLSGIYNNLSNTLRTYGPTYNLVFKPDADQIIRQRLDNLRAQELEIMKLLADADIKQRIQEAAKGSTSDQTLLDRQSNILSLTTNYNNSVSDINRILNEIGNAIGDRAKRITVSVSAPAFAQASVPQPIIVPQPIGSVTTITPYGISGNFII